MSYILEALRKAERERNPAQAEQPQDATRPRFAQISSLNELRPYRPVVIAVFCFALIIALSITVLKPRVAPNTTVATPAVLANTASNNAALPQQPVITATQVYSDGLGPATLDDLMDGASAPVNDGFPVYTEVPVPAHFNEVAPFTASEVVDVSTPETIETDPVRAAPTTAVERVQLDPAPPPQFTKLREMPSDYRAAFPTISLDVHSYDGSSQKRFIMIAGKRYNEGDALAEGPRVVQIVPEGVVFDFRSEQVLFTIQH